MLIDNSTKSPLKSNFLSLNSVKISQSYTLDKFPKNLESKTDRSAYIKSNYTTKSKKNSNKSQSINKSES